MIYIIPVIKQLKFATKHKKRTWSSKVHELISSKDITKIQNSFTQMATAGSIDDYLRLSWSRPVRFLKFYLRYKKKCICMECDSSHSLWYCLSCGHVGCDNLEFEHNKMHYAETKHRCGVRLQDLKIYDYGLNIWLSDLDPAFDVHEFDSLPVNIPAEFYSKCSCHVCLYKKTPRLWNHFTCMKCDVSNPQLLWLCMTCDHVGCGRYSKRHAIQHYKTSGHTIVSQLENLKTWHYTYRKYLELNSHVSDSSAKENNNNLGNTEEDGLIPIADNVSQEQNLKIAYLKEQQEALAKRVDDLTEQLEEFRHLPKTSHSRIVAIDNNLVKLEAKNWLLERKFCEQEKELNEIQMQVSASSEQSSPVRAIKPERNLDSPISPNMRAICDLIDLIILFTLFSILVCILFLFASIAATCVKETLKFNFL